MRGRHPALPSHTGCRRNRKCPAQSRRGTLSIDRRQFVPGIGALALGSWCNRLRSPDIVSSCRNSQGNVVSHPAGEDGLRRCCERRPAEITPAGRLLSVVASSTAARAVPRRPARSDRAGHVSGTGRVASDCGFFAHPAGAQWGIPGNPPLPSSVPRSLPAGSYLHPESCGNDIPKSAGRPRASKRVGAARLRNALSGHMPGVPAGGT